MNFFINILFFIVGLMYAGYAIYEFEIFYYKRTLAIFILLISCVISLAFIGFFNNVNLILWLWPVSMSGGVLLMFIASKIKKMKYVNL